MNLALLLNFTKQDFVDRYSGSVLGALWAFIHPLVMIFIFTVIFANVMGVRLPGVSSVYSYGIYLVAGLLPWTAFSGTVIRASTVFSDKKAIISKVSVSLPHLPLYIVLSESLTFLIAMSIFLGFLVFTGAELGRSLVLLPFVYVVQQILAFGLGLLFAVLNVFLRDVREMVSVLMVFWFWLTPIVWVKDIAPAAVQAGQAQFNPAYFFISAYQDIFVYGTTPDFGALIKLVLIAHGILLVSYLMLRSLEKDVRDFV